MNGRSVGVLDYPRLHTAREFRAWAETHGALAAHHCAVVVCGSRDWTDPVPIRERLARLDRGTWVIQGEGRGADRLAAQAAAELGHSPIGFPALWESEGRGAGPRRNVRMLECEPDLVIAFTATPHKSRGTGHCARAALRRGIPVELYDGEGWGPWPSAPSR